MFIFNSYRLNTQYYDSYLNRSEHGAEHERSMNGAEATQKNGCSRYPILNCVQFWCQSKIYNNLEKNHRIDTKLLKLLPVCAGNTNCNFGGSHRKEKNNTYSTVNYLMKFRVMKNSVTNENINEWQQNNKLGQDRWVGIFKYFTGKKIPFKNIFKIRI